MTSLAGIRTKLKLDERINVFEDSELDSAIALGYSKVQSDGHYLWDACLETEVFNTVIDQQEYDKPTNFQGVEDITYQKSPLDFTTRKILRNRGTLDFTGTPTEYYLYKTKIGLAAIPIAVGEIVMDYRKTLDPLSSSQDSELPVDTDEGVVYYAKYILMAKIKKNDLASSALAQYEELMSRVIIDYLTIDAN